MITIKSGLATLAVKFSSLVMGLLSVVLLARILGADVYGVYSYAMAIVTMLTVPSKAGLPSLVTRDLVYALSAGDPEKTRGIVRYSRKLVFQISGGTTILALAALALAAISNSSSSPDVFGTTAIGMILLPALALGSVRAGILRAAHRVALSQVPEYVVRPGALVSLVMLFYILGVELDAPRVMLIHVVGAIVASFVGYMWARRYLPDVFQAGSAAMPVGWRTPIIHFTLIGTIGVLIQQAPVLLLGIFSPMSDVAVFRVASQAAVVMLVGLSVINMTVEPLIARSFRMGNVSDLQDTLRRFSRLSFVIALGASAGFILSGEALLQRFIGSEYGAAYIPGVIMCVGVLFKSSFACVDASLKMTGNEKKVTSINVIAAVICVVSGLILVPAFGVIGAACTSTATMIIWTILLARASQKATGLRLGIV